MAGKVEYTKVNSKLAKRSNLGTLGVLTLTWREENLQQQRSQTALRLDELAMPPRESLALFAFIPY
ncbi:hypothetical protein J6590_010300 [Homalodisca vitripennis]|nr:hypothetical protein J6590_010300 [Homalodisca vitripennis]